MSDAAHKLQAPGLDALSASVDGEQFLRDFRRRMAEQGLIVRMANPQPDWEPGVTLNVPADELSEMVVRLRRGDA